jgi:hypothetical protein
MRRILGFAAVVCVVVLACLLLGRGDGPDLVEPGPPGAEPAGALPALESPARTGLPAQAVTTHDPPADTGGAAGSVEVRLRSAEDGSAIADEAILLAAGIDWERRVDGQTRRTDPDGVVRFEAVAPGWHSVVASRSAWRPIRVEPASLAVVELDLVPQGWVEGRVVDARGQGLAEAEVVAVPDRLPGAQAVLARSDAEGHFRARLRGVENLLFARKPGHGSSHALELRSSAREEHEIELVLPDGARPVRGVVVDGAGRPVAGAEVLVQTWAPRPTAGAVAAGAIERWPRARSAADGRFFVAEVPLGPFSGVARAPGFAPSFFDTQLQTEDQDREVLITMERGAGVRGRVVDDQGAPVAGALIEAEPGTALGPLHAWTDRHGNYLLSGIAVGLLVPARRLTVLASHRRAGFAGAELELDPDATAVWSPTLRAAGTIAGRVLRADGSPQPGLRVRAWAVGARAPSPVVSDDEGRFSLLAAADLPHEIAIETIFPFAEIARRSDVRPGGEDLAIVVADTAWPSAYVSGRLLRPEGYEAEPVRLRLSRDTPIFGAPIGVGTDGSFRLGPLVPGTYRGGLVGGDTVFGALELGPLTLSPAQDLDLGTIPIPAPVLLRLELRLPPAHPVGALVARLRRASDGVEVATLRHRDGVTRGGAGLVPGRYRLMVEPGPGQAGCVVDCELRSGPPNRITVEPEPLRQMRVLVRGLDGAKVVEEAWVRAEPATVLGDEFLVRDGTAYLSLRPGRHLLSARCAGREGQVEVLVDARTGPVMEVELRLR